MAAGRLDTIAKQLSELSSGKQQPFYFITGEEEYLRNKAIEGIVANLKSTAGDSTVQLVKLFGDEVEPENLEMALVSYSLFAETNVVLVRFARKMKKSCWDVVDKVVKEGLDSSVLILEDEKFDGRNKAVALAKKNGWLSEFPLLRDFELNKWIRSYAKRSGYSISDEAITYLRDSVEQRLSNYVLEFEKLKIFLTDTVMITLEDLESVTQETRQFNIFEFTDSLVEGNGDKAVEMIKKIITFDENITGIIVMIVRHLVALLKVKLHGKSQPDPRKLGISYYHIKKYQAQARRYSVDQLECLLEAALMFDADIKVGYRTDKLALTLLAHAVMSRSVEAYSSRMNA